MANKKRLIDADSWQESVEYLKRHLIVGDSEFLRGYLKGVEALADGLAKLTPVDAVEVVRCRDCKRCFKHTTKRNRQKMWICMRNDFDVCVRPDDFCSYGERKDDD